MENPAVLERQTLCFSSYKNLKLKVKLWWVGTRKRKKGSFLYRLFCPNEVFFLHLCFMSVYSVLYWIQFLKIHTFTYQKTLLHTLFCLLLKSWKAFSVSLSYKWLLANLLIHSYGDIILTIFYCKYRILFV